MFASPSGRASLQTSSWAPTRSGCRWAALRCNSASVTNPETSVSPSTSCSCLTAAPSVCQLTRKCRSLFFWLWDDACLVTNLGVNVFYTKTRGKEEKTAGWRANRKHISTSSFFKGPPPLSPLLLSTLSHPPPVYPSPPPLHTLYPPFSPPSAILYPPHPLSLQVCACGGAALRGGHPLPLSNTQLSASGCRGGQRGVRHADIPQCTAAEDVEGRRLQHQEDGPRRVSG